MAEPTTATTDPALLAAEYHPGIEHNDHGARARAWWDMNGRCWYGTEEVARLTTEDVIRDGYKAVCAILTMNGIKAWPGDGTGMIVNIVGYLVATRMRLDAEALRLRARVDELLAANNREVERRRAAVAALRLCLPHLVETAESMVQSNSTAYDWQRGDELPADCEPEALIEAEAMLRAITAAEAAIAGKGARHG